MTARIFVALLARLWRQHRLALLVNVVAIVLFEYVITRVAPQHDEGGFFAGLVALLPPDVASFVNDQLPLNQPQGVISLGYVHPFFLALLSGWAIRIGAGALAGEIGRGTMDILASRPVPRWTIVFTAWLTMALGLAVIVGAAWATTHVGVSIRHLDILGPWTWKLPALAWLLFVAWGGITLAIGAARRESGPAIAWSSGLIAASFVIEFLSRMWQPIAWTRRLSLFAYYRPQLIMNYGYELGWKDPTVVGVVAVVAIVVALVIFQRRDL